MLVCEVLILNVWSTSFSAHLYGVQMPFVLEIRLGDLICICYRNVELSHGSAK